MKYFILPLILFLFSCKKENTTPKCTVSSYGIVNTDKSNFVQVYINGEKIGKPLSTYGVTIIDTLRIGVTYSISAMNMSTGVSSYFDVKLSYENCNSTVEQDAAP